MNANAKSKARSLLTVGFVLGTITAAAVVAACSSSASDGQSSQEDGIGLNQINMVASSPGASMPVDATPSPDGKDIYFIAFTSKADEDGIKMLQVPAIYKAGATSAAPQLLFSGEPLNSPFGITISDDGKTLYIADSSADGSNGVADRSDGRVFSLPTGGGTLTALAGTEGIVPAGVEVLGDSLYVTGRKDGQPGLFKTGLAGGSVTAVATGAPFADPGGVAIGRDGVAYVVDTGSVTNGQALASVVKVTPDGKTEIVIDGLAVGHPAGIALVSDGSALLVSGLDSAEGTDRVFRVALGDHSMRQLSTTIGGFNESAGLHRARNAEVFAWADSHANGPGTVYMLTP